MRSALLGSCMNCGVCPGHAAEAPREKALMSESAILTVNTGSSSLKLGVYTERREGETLVLEGLAEGIGQGRGSLTLRDGDGRPLRSKNTACATQQDALREATAWIGEVSDVVPCAVGHRIVHGGPHLTQHQRITPDVLEELRRCIHFAPLHIPMALDLVEQTEHAYPGVPQFACFDTAFHRTLPETASMFPLPRGLFEEGIRRYGFHGLSYESVVRQLGKGLPSRVVAAHLGSGASLAAIGNGSSVDTTMGLTPTGGIPMATRCGDLDPGVLLYLMRNKGADADTLEPLLNREAGLKALSGGTVDMRQLLEKEKAGDGEAALAVETFCVSIAKTIAAYAAVLSGVDMLVFAGGIGEHSPAIRDRVCERLHFFGVQLDAAANEGNASTISALDSRVRVCVLESKEDLEIARHCRRMLAGGSA